MRIFLDEFIAALVIILAVTGLYAYLAGQYGIPRPGGGIGLMLGGAGLLLMLAAETLYSIRKRVPGLHWGRMENWLHVHVVCGLVGAYLVGLHSGGRFHGLAGVLLTVTIVIVMSGLIGRYIYTAVPRNIDGAEIDATVLQSRLVQAEAELVAAGVNPATWGPALAAASSAPEAGWRLVIGRPLLRWRFRRRLRRILTEMLPAQPELARRVERLLERRFKLQLQLRSLAAARQMLAWWHALHVPIGAVLFTLAAVHVAGALYYQAR
jgi:hypothetical protein